MKSLYEKRFEENAIIPQCVQENEKHPIWSQRNLIA